MRDGARSFEVRQLAAAFQGSQLSGNLNWELETLNSELKSGSKLPHSEVPCGRENYLVFDGAYAGLRREIQARRIEAGLIEFRKPWQLIRVE